LVVKWVESVLSPCSTIGVLEDVVDGLLVGVVARAWSSDVVDGWHWWPELLETLLCCSQSSIEGGDVEVLWVVSA
jgi:hypothetical protein